MPGNFNDVFTSPESITFVRTFSFTYFENPQQPPSSNVQSVKEVPKILPSTTPKVIDGLKNFVQKSVENSLLDLLEVQKTVNEDNNIDKLEKSCSEISFAPIKTLKVISAVEDSASTNSTTTVSSDISSSASATTIPEEKDKQNLLFELQKILLKNEYTDVILKASNGIEVKSYRCILAAHSPAFKSIFDFTETLPVEIECFKFGEETVLRAISFLYGKDDLLEGDELNLLEFANEYVIDALKVCFIA